MEKIINGATVKVNEEGYLTDFTQWNKNIAEEIAKQEGVNACLLYTSPSPRDRTRSRMPSSA